MKQIIIASLIGVSLLPLLAGAQTVVRKSSDTKATKPELTERAQSLYTTEQPSEADVQWMRGIYRSLDLTKDKNLPLYYPEEPMEGQESLFRMIMRLLSQGTIEAYDYLDGREVFTDTYKLNVKDMFDRFRILYQEKEGRSTKNPRFTLEESDIPANEVLSYYIKEKWIFDQRDSKFYAIVEAICPVLHRTGDFGGEAMKYPMFWIPVETLRPYMAQQYIMTDNTNNVQHFTYDDYFKLRMYDGEIYKTANLRNMSLMQLYPNDSALTKARENIEKQLTTFDENLWVKVPVAPLASNAKKTKKQDSNEESKIEVTGAVEKQETEKSPEQRSTVRSDRGTKKSDSVKTAKSSSSREKTKSAPARSVRRR